VDTSRFWEIIDTARVSSGPGKPFDQALAGYLATRTQQDILQYQERFDEVHAALYRWDVWAAAYLIGGGCSDDSFIDFRAGLIAEGRDWYEKVAASPDSLAGHPAIIAETGHTLFYEQVNYAAPRAFERIGGSMAGFYAALNPDRVRRDNDADMGEDFDFDNPQEMRRRLPRLSAACLPDDAQPPRRLLAR
jgi:Protein of unknown function (DUF4240)